MFTFSDFFVDSYRLGEQIGQPGSSGIARLGTHLETGETYTVKVISKLRLKDRAAWDLMRSEVLIMQKLHELNHVNHIQLKEYFEDENAVFLVMECATGGELFDRIIKKRRFTEHEAARVACQMFEAVRAMHELGVVHAGMTLFSTVLSGR